MIVQIQQTILYLVQVLVNTSTKDDMDRAASNCLTKSMWPKWEILTISVLWPYLALSKLYCCPKDKLAKEL